MGLPINEVICGDCVEIMRAWPADSIDLAVTSPPYWGLRDYGVETVRVWGGDPGCEHEWGKLKTKWAGASGGLGYKQDTVRGSHFVNYYDRTTSSNFCVKCGAWRGSLGLEPHPQQFIDHLVEVCREIRRVLKPSGTFWLNLGDTYFGTGSGQKREHYLNPKNPFGQKFAYKGSTPADWYVKEKPWNKLRSNWLQPKQLLGIPWRVAIALQEDGWLLRNDVIWFKPNHMPSSVKDRLTNAYEHVFLLVKRRRYHFDLDAIRKPYSAATIQRVTQPNVMNQRGGDKQRELRGEGGGNASRCADMVRSLVLRNWGAPKGRYGGEGVKDYEGARVQNPSDVKRRIIEGAMRSDFKGKNPGDLWSIPTMPFPAAHFATFPPALIEPIVKAGCPKWICSKCGKPRIRIVEKTGYIDHPQREGRNVKAVQFSKEENKYISGGTLGLIAQEETVGWSDCGCGEGLVGGVVLDPFCGSGTALRVARRLGRRFIGIDIVPEYCDMARRRVRSEKYREPPEGVASIDLLNKSIVEADGE